MKIIYCPTFLYSNKQLSMDLIIIVILITNASIMSRKNMLWKKNINVWRQSNYYYIYMNNISDDSIKIIFTNPFAN